MRSVSTLKNAVEPCGVLLHVLLHSRVIVRSAARQMAAARVTLRRVGLGQFVTGEIVAAEIIADVAAEVVIQPVVANTHQPHQELSDHQRAA